MVRCYWQSDDEVEKFLENLIREYAKQFRDSSVNDKLTGAQLESLFAMADQDMRFNIFRDSIIKSINNAQPIVWLLVMGIVNEKMRLNRQEVMQD